MTGSLVLPIPSKFEFSVIEKIIELEKHNKGYYSLEYVIEEEFFVVLEIFNINDVEILLSKSKYPYEKDLWFSWNGGYYSKGEIYTQTIKEGIYDSVSTAPLCKRYDGMRDSEGIREMVYVDNQIVNDAYQMLMTENKKTINDKYLLEENSDITEMTYYYHMLNSMSNLTGINRRNLIEKLNDDVLMEERNIEHKVLNYVVDMMENLSIWCDENKVDINEIDNSIQVETQLTEENKILKQVTSSIGHAIMSVVSEEQKEQILQIFRQQLAINGISNVNLLT